MNPGNLKISLTGLKPPDNHSSARRTGWLSGFMCLLPLLAGLLLAGCRPAETEIYRPPTLSAPVHLPSPTPSITPTTRAVLETPIATTVPACTDDLTFQEDMSIPDGTLVSPGEVLDKRWQVLNSGTCNWEAGYRLELLSGPTLGAASPQALYPARSGSQAVIRMLFTAPTEPGTYQSAWQAYNPQGSSFGDPIYIQIVVLSRP